MSLSPHAEGTEQAQPETVALFVSDLHLTAAMPKTAAAFFSFLRKTASKAGALYLLGDIFEYWAGDDDLDDPFNRQVVDAIAALSAQGVAVFWMAGNRDFLVGDRFAHACGLTLLSDPTLVTLAGQRTLLVHGDAQCTDDTAYMQFRQQVRSAQWQQQFLQQTLAQRKAIIASLREGSREAQRGKSMDIMDVNPQAIDALFASHAVKIMIHGHTHRPHTHLSQSAAGPRTRYVLPDWDYDTRNHAARGGWLALDARGQFSFHQAGEVLPSI